MGIGYEISKKQRKRENIVEVEELTLLYDRHPINIYISDIMYFMI
jgi:hypothetical protein